MKSSCCSCLCFLLFVSLFVLAVVMGGDGGVDIKDSCRAGKKLFALRSVIEGSLSVASSK